MGNITIDKDFYQITIDGREIFLTRNRFKVFCVLYENRNKTCTMRMLKDYCYGKYYNIDPSAIRVLIKCIRDTLKETPLKDAIQTRQGIGYRLVENE